MKPTLPISPLNRRKFLGATAATVAGFTLVPRHVLGGPKFVAPSAKVNIALIGAGGQGRTNVRSLFNEADAQVIALADPAERTDYSGYYYGGEGGRLPVKAEIEKQYSAKTPNFKCAAYVDFREMLEKEKAIDAILCATPDHWHALVCITAMKQGKHAYCEKPLTHSIWEARMMAKVAKETGVATQMGNQGHSGEGIRTTCEWIWDGAIGDVREVHGWSDNGLSVGHTGLPKDKPAVPAGLDWNLWQGPRAERAYHPEYAPFNWRYFWNYGSGVFGDMACHNLDPAFWALDLASPEIVEASAASKDPETTPTGAIYRYSFGARGKMPPVKVVWYDGGLMPERPIELEDDDVLGGGGNGVMFVGDKGIIACAGWGGPPHIIPQSMMDAYTRPPKTLPRSKGHHRDWLDACKGGSPASANFDYGARLTEFVLLGNVALRTGKRLKWDAANMKATNAPEADKLIKESYRKGFEIPV